MLYLHYPYLYLLPFWTGDQLSHAWSPDTASPHPSRLTLSTHLSAVPQFPHLNIAGGALRLSGTSWESLGG